MKAAKTETITVRVEPAVKAGLKSVAAQERRSLANMIEVMIRDYCDRSAVQIEDKANNSPATPRRRRSRNER